METSASLTTPVKKRIAFIDLTRAYAILMMVQGHTIESLIAKPYRDYSNPIFYLWEANRGLTAPLFLFMSGCIFTLLLIKAQTEHGNVRARKGVKRAGLLLLMAYALQFNPGIFQGFPHSLNLETFGFVIKTHVLHCISIGLLLLTLIHFISRWLKIDSLWILMLCTLLVFAGSSYMIGIEWDNYVPRVFGNYLTDRYGSIFPLFPWHGYLFAGACLGNLFTKFTTMHQRKRFALGLIIGGVSISLLVNPFFSLLFKAANWQVFAYHVTTETLNRLFIVLAITGFFAFLCIYIKNIPKWIMIIGSNTLWIYVIHIFIVYDTFISHSMFYSLRGTLSFGMAALCAVLAILLVIGILFGYRRFAIKYNIKFRPK